MTHQVKFFIDLHGFWRYPFFLKRNLRKTPEPLLRYPVRPQRWIVLPCSRPAPVQRPARHWPRPCQGLLWPWQDGEASKKQPKEWIQYIVLDISERKGCCLQEDFGQDMITYTKYTKYTSRDGNVDVFHILPSKSKIKIMHLAAQGMCSGNGTEPSHSGT